ncbi:hypothetical protein [Levilactobacillus brevis]|uniref:hypothetical protein n=1 Tax=Levilactobacillus brevis TaxID=1580 RepID=UPI0030CD29DB
MTRKSYSERKQLSELAWNSVDAYENYVYLRDLANSTILKLWPTLNREQVNRVRKKMAENYFDYNTSGNAKRIIDSDIVK